MIVSRSGYKVRNGLTSDFRGRSLPCSPGPYSECRMTLDSRPRPRSVLAAGLIVGLVVGSGATASATETEEPRAASREGGVTTCDPFGGGPLVAAGESER